MNFHHKHQGIHTGFDILVTYFTSTGQVPVFMQDLHSPNGRKVQAAFFRYRFIFIFQRQGEAIVGEWCYLEGIWYIEGNT